jgi:hypothetical protein
MPSDSLTILYRSGYYIALALGVASFFNYIPSWVPIALLVASFILHWQCNLKKTALRKEAENQLYDRYASDLQTRDFVTVSANILGRIDKLKAANPTMSRAFAERLNDLKAYFGDRTVPLPIMHALLRDFEFAVEYSNIRHPDAIEKSKVLIDRTAEIERWLELTGTAPTQEEMDAASREMLRDTS